MSEQGALLLILPIPLLAIGFWWLGRTLGRRSALPGGDSERPRKPRCSFCSKDEGEARKLIAGADGFICDECVRLCVTILDEQGVTAPDD